MTDPTDEATPGCVPGVDRKRPHRTRPVSPPRVPIPDDVKKYDVSDAYDHADPDRQSVVANWMLSVGRYSHAVTSAAKADNRFSQLAGTYDHADPQSADAVLRACAEHLSTLERVRLAKADVTATALRITELTAGKAVADFVRAALIGGQL